MSRSVHARAVFKLAVLALAVLSGLVECAALVRARLAQQISGLRQA